jgi:hypothetical protein
LAQPEASGATDLLRRATALADHLEGKPGVLGSLIATGSLAQGRLQLELDATAIAAALEVPIAALSDHLSRISRAFVLRRRGAETRIISGETVPAPDEVLQRTLAEAHLWARALRRGSSLTEIARETRRSEPYIRNRILLAFLAPKLQAAILDGRQPAHLSVAQLIREDIPLEWKEQARLFESA